MAESRGKVDALKSLDTAKQLRTAHQDIESLQEERDSLKTQLSLAQEAEQRARTQLKETLSNESRKTDEEVKRLKQELQDNENMWNGKVQELEEVAEAVVHIDI